MYCFVDTNILLHYQFFMEINWCDELKAKHVVLVVCPVVLSELDEKKSPYCDSRVASRARTVISKLAEIGKPDKEVQIRPDVGLLLITEAKINFDSQGLDPRIADDRIIAAVLSKSTEKGDVILVTSDLGMKLKAESKKIRLHLLPDKLLLESTKGAEQKEITKLREEVSRLIDRLPVLVIKLTVKDEITDVGRFCLQKILPLSPEDVGNQLSEIRKKLQYSPLDRKLVSVLGRSALPSESEIKHYKNAADKYIELFPAYLQKKWDYDEMRSRSIEFCFVLVNEGTVPAKDIDVRLNFPDGFEMRSDERQLYLIPDDNYN